MRQLLFILVLLGHQTSSAQAERPAPDLPFKKSISATVGIPLLPDQKENGKENTFLRFLPSRSAALSLNVYKGFSLKGGLWRASYLSPGIPEDYDENAFISFGGDPNKVYDAVSGSYILLAYDYYVPITRRASDIKFGLQLQPAAGLGQTRLREAHFTVHVPVYSGFRFFNSDPTHDYQHTESSASGFAGQLGVYGYFAVNRKFLIHLGPALFTMPGPSKRIYGVDIGGGFSVCLQK